MKQIFINSFFSIGCVILCLACYGEDDREYATGKRLVEPCRKSHTTASYLADTSEDGRHLFQLALWYLENERREDVSATLIKSQKRSVESSDIPTLVSLVKFYESFDSEKVSPLLKTLDEIFAEQLEGLVTWDLKSNLELVNFYTKEGTFRDTTKAATLLMQWEEYFLKTRHINKCLVPKSYGVIYTELKETHLWEVYCMVMPRQRLESEKKYKTLWRAPQG